MTKIQVSSLDKSNKWQWRIYSKEERSEEKWNYSKKQIEGGKDAQLSGLGSDENIGTSQTRSNQTKLALEKVIIIVEVAE